jgi:LPS sulfotransferase NodH
MLYPQFWDADFSRAKQWIMNDKQLMFIHLVRKNTLQVLISLKRATLSNEWWRMDPGFLEGLERIGIGQRSPEKNINKTAEALAFSIDPLEVQRFFVKSEEQTLQVKRELTGHPVLEISYEALLQQPQETTTSMLNFLGVSHQALTSRNIMQNTRAMRENLSNFEVLIKYFSESQWEVFFDE